MSSVPEGSPPEKEVSFVPIQLPVARPWTSNTVRRIVPVGSFTRQRSPLSS